MIRGVSTLGRRHREQIVIAAGDVSRSPDAMTRKRDQFLGLFDTSFLDIFFVEYVSPDDKPDDVRIALDLVSEWKEAGIIRYVGASVHDRDIARDLAESGQVDVLMHRYNMAHLKSEDSVLPRAKASGVPVVAFTCTRWGSLLNGHARWQAPVPTASDCYQFALSHSAVRLALMAPASVAELDQNIQNTCTDLLSDPDRAKWSEYGDLVYGDGMDAFETRWP